MLARAGAGSDWIAFEREFQQRNLEAIRKYPTTPFTRRVAAARWARSRARYVDPERAEALCRLELSGHGRHIARHLASTDGAIEKLHDIKEPRIYTVTSLAYDPAEQTLFYTADNHAYRDLVALDRRHAGSSGRCCKDARIGELAFNRSRPLAVGHPHAERHLHAGPHSRPVHGVERGRTRGRTARPSTTSTCRRTASCCRRRVGEINGRQSAARDGASRRCWPATRRRSTQFDFGTAIPSNFVFSPDGRICSAARTTPASRTFSATRSRPGALEAVTNAETGFFRPDSARRRLAARVPLHRRRLRARASIQAAAAGGRQRDHVLRRAARREAPGAEGLGGRSPGDVPIESMITGKRRVRPLRRLGLESIYPVVEGYKDTVGYGGARATSRIRVRLNPPSLTASYSPVDDLAASERLHLRADYRRYDWTGARRCNGADFYDLFGPTKTQPQGLRGRGSATSDTLIFDEPRRLTLDRRRSCSPATSTAARIPERRRSTSNRLFTGSRRPVVHERPLVARRRRRREGAALVDGGAARTS